MKTPGYALMMNRWRVPMTAAALALILSACGGGSSGSSDRSVSSSPEAPSAGSSNPGSTTPGSTGAGDANGSAGSGGSQIADGGSTPNTGNTPGSNGGAGTDANTTPTPPAQPPAPQTTDQLISAAGISGAALLSMLDQELNRAWPLDTPTTSPADGRHGWFLENGLMQPGVTTYVSLAPQLNYTYTPRPNGNPYPNITYEPLNGSTTYWLRSYVQFRGGRNKQSTVPYRELSLTVPLQVDAQQITIGDLLSVKTGPTLANPRADDPQNDKTEHPVVDFKAETAYTVPKNGLIPFGQVLKQWNGADGQRVQLVLEGRCDLLEDQYDPDVTGFNPGPNPVAKSGAELCWHVDMSNVKRKLCFMFQMPAPAEDAANNYVSIPMMHEIIDDRSVYAGETGTKYWRQGRYRCQGKGGL
ncbi:MAG: hypothetical protein Q4D91_00500 [Lautropia sp.]|nr:hypothetical protein [Lautropia sp.]